MYKNRGNLISKIESSTWNAHPSQLYSIMFGFVTPIHEPYEILPGDIWHMSNKGLIRMLTPLAPFMGRITFDIYYYFVPYRLIWSKSKQFFGENDQVAFQMPQNVKMPHLNFILDPDKNEGFKYRCDTVGNYILEDNDSKNGTLSLLEYFNTAVCALTQSQYSEIVANGYDFSLNALPFRAYQLIWNDCFRNPAVTDPALDLVYDGNDFNLDDDFEYFMSSDGTMPSFKGLCLRKATRLKDVFTTALFQPQRGTSPIIELGLEAPLFADDTLYSVGGNIAFGDTGSVGADVHSFNHLLIEAPNANSTEKFGKGAVVSDSQNPKSYSSTYQKGMTKTNLKVDLSNASGLTVQALRDYVALQHLEEMLARSLRYRDFVKVFFGVSTPNKELDYPQYIGGAHGNLVVSQVLATADTGNNELGQTGAYSLTGYKQNIFTHAFGEHGLLMPLIVIRKQHRYCQGMPELFMKRDLTDTYLRPFSHVGFLPLKKDNIWWQNNKSKTFGFQEYGWEYRYFNHRASGLLNPLVTGNISQYGLTDVYFDEPYLSEQFISEDFDGLDNALIATAEVGPQFFGIHVEDIKMSRRMPLYSNPGLEVL